MVRAKAQYAAELEEYRAKRAKRMGKSLLLTRAKAQYTAKLEEYRAKRLGKKYFLFFLHLPTGS